ncbi:MAG: fumarylacetoacetate hydrolase family protein [Myxococcota bacterium]
MTALTYLDSARPPVTPPTIYCLGRNYRAHAAELGNPVPEEPVVFLKAPSTLRGLEPAPVAFADETFSHELELCIVLGRPVALGGTPSWADIGAVAVGIDLTRRGVQRVCKERRLPWTPSKSFAGAALVGPLLPRDDVDVSQLAFRLEVGSETRQDARVDRMIFDVPTLLRHLASLAPLQLDDVVFTGTPEGVGPLSRGERFTLHLDDGRTQWRFPGEL